MVQHPARYAIARTSLAQPDGTVGPTQIVERDGDTRLLLHVADVPSLGYRAYPLVERQPLAAAPMIVQPDYLENRFYQIELNSNGQITRLFDKINRREVIAPDAVGNMLQVFDDRPMAFDAWDIDIFYAQKMQVIDQLIDATVEEQGPLRGVLRLRWRWGRSTITVRVTLYAHDPRIDFQAEVDWHEQQQLLKVAFPVTIRSTKATYDIQWGNIERPTHWNTSWDWAHFESVGHKWVDLSEGNYGVALLNDCKYGHDVKDNVLRLTLIKSPVRPDPQADQGRHVFTYSLLPHAGDFRAGRVAQAAYDLNYPLHAHLIAAQHGGRLGDSYAWASVDADHVIIETIKRAEDDDAWIVRVYEYQQCRNQQVTITFNQPIARAAECDLMEAHDQLITFDTYHMMCALAPYEIKTFKVWFKPS